MTLEHAENGELEGGVAVAACAVCGHAESEHTVQEAEEAGTTVTGEYCLECEEWHGFVAAAEE